MHRPPFARVRTFPCLRVFSISFRDDRYVTEIGALKIAGGDFRCTSTLDQLLGPSVPWISFCCGRGLRAPPFSLSAITTSPSFLYSSWLLSQHPPMSSFVNHSYLGLIPWRPKLRHAFVSLGPSHPLRALPPPLYLSSSLLLALHWLQFLQVVARTSVLPLRSFSPLSPGPWWSISSNSTPRCP